MKKFFFVITIVVVLSLLVLRMYSTSQEELLGVEDERYTFAVCPTMYRRFQGREDIILSETTSTSNSVDILQAGLADYVISGRVPKPEEGIVDFVILEEGFSFLSARELALTVDEIINEVIYTDQEDLKNVLDNVVIVDDVYDYLDNIVVTSLSNTDYNRAQVVHVYNLDGTRWDISRSPVLYCMDICSEDVLL